MQNARLDELQAGIKIIGRSINNLCYAEDTLMAESEEELRASWWKWKKGVKKLAWVSTLKKIYKIPPWHPVPLLHGR